MAGTFGWRELNGASSTVSTPTDLNLGSDDSTDLVATTYPITAGGNSYEKYVVGNFTGTFTKIDNIKFWKSAGAYVTGETMDWRGTTGAYTQPVNTTSAVAITAIPTSEPAVANVGIGGATTGNFSAAGTTNYIVMQSHVSTAASAGATNTKTFTFQYDEV